MNIETSSNVRRVPKWFLHNIELGAGSGFDHRVTFNREHLADIVRRAEENMMFVLTDDLFLDEKVGGEGPPAENEPTYESNINDRIRSMNVKYFTDDPSSYIDDSDDSLPITSGATTNVVSLGTQEPIRYGFAIELPKEIRFPQSDISGEYVSLMQNNYPQALANLALAGLIEVGDEENSVDAISAIANKAIMEKVVDKAIEISYARRLLTYGILPNEILVDSQVDGNEDWRKHLSMFSQTKREEIEKNPQDMDIRIRELLSSKIRRSIWRNVVFKGLIDETTQAEMSITAKSYECCDHYFDPEAPFIGDSYEGIFRYDKRRIVFDGEDEFDLDADQMSRIVKHAYTPRLLG